MPELTSVAADSLLSSCICSSLFCMYFSFMLQAVVRWERQMGPHNFQKHNIRYPRPLASVSTSTSTAPSTVPSHSGSTCAWAAGPPTLFPSYYSPVLQPSCPCPELPSPTLSPHYQASPTFFYQQDITPTTSYEMGRLYDLSMTASLSCEGQEEDMSPLTKRPGAHHC